MDSKSSTSKESVTRTDDFSESSKKSPERKVAPSFAGLIASQRCARRLHKQLIEKKSQFSPAVEPTYRLLPDEFFDTRKTFAEVKGLVERAVANLRCFDPTVGPRATKVLSEQISKRIHDTGVGRYKLIVTVMIGEVKGQGLKMVSKCLWNKQSDTYVSFCTENSQVYCLVNVYAVYKD
ncbi:dynein light chain Tctex-type protein 2B-like [Watersipora subatra]|uniref:dynein light chain Tctex-type protein 2B-like n=1 Tax=Watersipora subatra TaxID=2589382 RepID=UPI00355B47DF